MKIQPLSFEILKSFFADLPRLDRLFTHHFKQNKTSPADKQIIFEEVSAYIRLLPVHFYEMGMDPFNEQVEFKYLINTVRDFVPFRYRKEFRDRIKSAPKSDWYKLAGLPQRFADSLFQQHSDLEVAEFLIKSVQPRPIQARLFKSGNSPVADFEPIGGIPFAYQFTGDELSFKDDWFQQGWFELQDLSSQLACLLVNPKPTETVLDACAGSGGKSLSLASIMKGKGKVYSVITQEFEEKEIRNRSSKKNLGNISVLNFENPKLNDLTGKSDIVWVDAPCSGSGVIRRNPDIIYRFKDFDLGDFQTKQLELLKDYSKFLKPGGKLVYSTCSVFEEENQSVIRQFIDSSEGKFERDTFQQAITYFNLPLQNQSEFTFGFDSNLNSDGFYLSVLKKQN